MVQTDGMDSELVAMVRDVVDANRYLTLGTQESTGVPRLSPVYFTHDGYATFYWVSSPEAQHSRNVAERPDVAIVVYDSTAPVGQGRAVYLSATAAQVPDADLPAECVVAFANVGEDAVAFTPEELREPAGLRLYRARATGYEVHIRGSDPTYGKGIDRRLAVRMP